MQSSGNKGYLRQVRSHRSRFTLLEVPPFAWVRWLTVIVDRVGCSIPTGGNRLPYRKGVMGWLYVSSSVGSPRVFVSSLQPFVEVPLVMKLTWSNHS